MNEPGCILVVDDEPGILWAYRHLLSKAGYAVIEAATGKAGIDMVRRYRPDLVLLDVVLPDVSGFEVCRQIKTDPVLMDTLVLLCSGLQTKSEQQVQGLEMRADGYIVRPIPDRELLARLEAVLRIGRVQKELRGNLQLSKKAQEIARFGYWNYDFVGNKSGVWSESMYHIFGITPDEFEGSYEYLLTLIHPSDRESVKEAFEAALANGQAFDLEYRIIRPDGYERHLHMVAEINYNGNGQAIGLFGVTHDITERKWAEKELRQQREDLQVVLDSVPALIFYKDVNNRIVRANKTWFQTLNYTAHDVIGKSLSEFLPGELAATLYSDDLEVIRSRLPKRNILEFFNVDGELRTFLTDKIPHQNASGQTIGVIGFSQDITDRKRVEESLQAAVAYNRSLLEASLDPLVTISTEGRITDVNAATERVIGYSRDELIGTDFADYFTDSPMAKDGYRKAFRDGSVKDYALDIRHRDGHSTPVMYNASVYTDHLGKVAGLFAAARDITERKQSEDALREAHEFLENLLDCANAPIIVWDDQFKITRFNRAFERITGRSSSEVLGLGLDFIFPPEKRAELLEYIQHSSDGEPWKTVEIPIQHQDGSVRILLWNSSTLYGADGKTVVAAIAQGHDITERRRAREEQRKTEAKLAQFQKMEAIGALARGIAHDFKNILGIIMGYTELGKTQLPEDGKAGHYAEEVLKACRRAKDLINQILSFSRPEDEKLEGLALDIRPIIKEIVKFLKSTLPSTIEIHQNISSEDGMVHAHPTQIYQVLMNLCTNAAQAMEDTCGILEVSLTDEDLCRETTPPHSGFKPGPYVRLSVADTGCGMDSPTLERIFDPYFTTKGKDKGTGLGLSVVHGIVTSLEGVITVHSEMGKGTTFHLYLPRIDGSSRTMEEPDPPTPGGTERILIVDDEALFADAWQKNLERLGYKVVIRTSCLEALELFRIHPEYFDLVITDYVMPHMTGVDLAERMMSLRPDIPLILCTGWSDRIIQEKTKQSGFRAFMQKPLGLHDVADTIRKVLDEK